MIAAPRSSRPLAAVAVAAVAVHGALLWLYHAPVAKRPWGDEVTYLEAARGLLAGNPGWHLDPLWPELYVRFLAGLSALWPSAPLAAVQLAQTLLLVAAAAVMADLARRLVGDPIAGWAAAAWMLAYPPLVAFAHFLWPEVLHLFLLLAVVWILTVHRESIAWCAGAGVALGLALLTKSLLQPFAPILVALLVVRRPWRRGLLRAAVCLALALLTVTPVLVDNARRLGRAMIADSTAFNLWVGLNDTSRRSFGDQFAYRVHQEMAVSGLSHRDQVRELRRRSLEMVRRDGLMTVLGRQLGRQYFRLFDRDSFLTDQLPGGDIGGHRQRWGYRRPPGALTESLRWLSYGLYALLLVSAPVGFFLTGLHRHPTTRALLLFLAYNLGIFLLLHVKSRYRIQFLPVLILGSAAAVAWWRERSPAGGEVGRRWAAAAAAVLLFFLAFAGPWLD